MNLLTDDIEEIAERVKLRAMARGLIRCYVGPTGETSMVTPNARHSMPLGDDCLVGTYTNRTPVADIEDDLVCRMRELTVRKAA